MLTKEEIVNKLSAVGFKRWTKGNIDRLYINASQLGLVCGYYNTGNIKWAELNGKSISNSQARRMKGSKTFYDLNQNKVYSDSYTLEEVANELVEKTLGIVGED